jgi:hypothetical protein
MAPVLSASSDVNDVIGIFLDFDKSQVEFFKNGTSQGVAFDNLTGPVFAGVSLTAKAGWRAHDCVR